MLTKNLVFYIVASTIIGLIAQAAGASLAVALFLALLVPPVILLLLEVIRHTH